MLAKCVAICTYWKNVLFLEKCAIFGEMCCFWINVLFSLDNCAVFGWMCCFFYNFAVFDICDVSV